jgi:serine/threonine protein kinase
VTDAFVNILSRMLNTNADNRPTADDILQDEWFQIDSSSKAAQI